MPTFEPVLMPLMMRSGFCGREFEDAELGAIGRAAFDFPTEELAVAMFLVDDERMQVGDRVAHAALLDRRRDDGHVAPPGQHIGHGLQARRVDAVVVHQQNLNHRSLRMRKESHERFAAERSAARRG